MHELGRLFKTVRRAESLCREETDLIQRIRIAFFRKAVHPEVGLLRVRRNFFRFITGDIFVCDIPHCLGIAVFRFFQPCFEGGQLHAEGRYEFIFIRTGKLHIADHVPYRQRRAVLSAHPLEGRLIPIAADNDAFPVGIVIRVELRKSEAVTVPLEDRGSAHEQQKLFHSVAADLSRTAEFRFCISRVNDDRKVRLHVGTEFIPDIQLELCVSVFRAGFTVERLFDDINDKVIAVFDQESVDLLLVGLIGEPLIDSAFHKEFQPFDVICHMPVPPRIGFCRH